MAYENDNKEHKALIEFLLLNGANPNRSSLPNYQRPLILFRSMIKEEAH